MKEEVLHFIWQHGLFEKQKLLTINGEEVSILQAGKLNSNSGPDFFNAKIKIGNILFVGNVELHIDGQDWYKHKHQNDPAYKNVILHVVAQNPISTTIDNKYIPTLNIGPLIEKAFIKSYTFLQQTQIQFPCQNLLELVPTSILEEQWNWAAEQRIIKKAQIFQDLYVLAENRIDQAFLILLTRNFGYGINNEIAQMLGARLPIKLIYKYMHSLFQLEALILGLSGLLNKESNDDYYLELEKEYRFLKTQYHLQELPLQAWKFSKTRPGNFPSIRLAQLAALLHKKHRLIPEIFEAQNIKDLYLLFESNISPYWQEHYAANQKHPLRQLQLSKSGINSIIINSVIPLWVWEGMRSEKVEFWEKAKLVLNEIAFEDNKYTRMYKNVNHPKENAYFSQASYYQAKEMCEKKQCLKCKIGKEILKSN